MIPPEVKYLAQLICQFCGMNEQESIRTAWSIYEQMSKDRWRLVEETDDEEIPF